MKIIVCDDDKQEAEYVSNLILEIVNDWEQQSEVLCLCDNSSMVQDIQEAEANVVFLDIDMPIINGLEIANKLSQIAPFITIIFLTNHSELVFESLRYRPFRFIRKSKVKEELGEALTAAVEKYFMETRVLFLQNKKESLSVPVNRIIYIESKRHYLELHLNQMNMMDTPQEDSDTIHYDVCSIRGKISDCEQQLEDIGFIRTHVGFLVNIRYIARINAQIIILDTGEKIPISRNRSIEVQRKYMWGMERYLNGHTV